MNDTKTRNENGRIFARRMARRIDPEKLRQIGGAQIAPTISYCNWDLANGGYASMRDDCDAL